MPVFIRPIVPTSNKKQYVVAPDGSVLDVGLMPVSKDAKNLLTVDDEGLCVKASDIVSRSPDNMLSVGADGRLFISGTISPEVSADEYNYARIGRDGGLFISGNDILSNGDINLLTIDPTDHKIILTRAGLLKAMPLVSTDKDNVISSGSDGGAYLAIDDLIADDDPLLFVNGDKQIATSIKLKYNPGNGALDLIGQNGDVITSVTVPTSTSSLKGVYLLNGKPDAMGATTAGDYHFSLQYSMDNGISWGAPIPVTVTATKGMESAGTLPGVEGVNKVRAFFHDLQAESIVSANKATLVFSDETKLTVTPGIEETTFTFMPAVGIETGVFLCFVFLLSDGTVQDVYVDLSTLVDVYAPGDGISITAGDVPIISAKVKDDGGVLVDSSGLHLDLNWINSHITAPTPDVNQGNGITVTDETGAVTVSAKPKENGGVTVDADGISITTKPSGGILVDGTGLYVDEEWLEEHAPAPKGGNGISISGSTVSVKPNENGGIIADNLGVAVNATEGGGLVVDGTGVHIDESWLADNTFKPVEGNGITISGSTISAKPKEGGGIIVDGTGISVDTSWLSSQIPVYEEGGGITIAGTTVSVKPNMDAGIVVDSSGIAINVKDSGGLAVDSTGVYIDESWLSGKIPKYTEGNGITISGSTVSVKPNENGGIIADNLGVAVNVTEGGGLVVDGTGVHIDESWLADNTFKPVEGNGISISGSTISVKPKENGGIIADDTGVYAPLATPDTPGIMRPDNTTCTVENGVLTALGVNQLYDLGDGELNLYVRPDGSDSNDGLANTPERAWASIDHAVEWINERRFTGAGWITVRVADGTYTATGKRVPLACYGAQFAESMAKFPNGPTDPVNPLMWGTCRIRIIGNISDPSAVRYVIPSSLPLLTFVVSGCGVYGLTLSIQPGASSQIRGAIVYSSEPAVGYMANCILEAGPDTGVAHSPYTAIRGSGRLSMYGNITIRSTSTWNPLFLWWPEDGALYEFGHYEANMAGSGSPSVESPLKCTVESSVMGIQKAYYACITGAPTSGIVRVVGSTISIVNLPEYRYELAMPNVFQSYGAGGNFFPGKNAGIGSVPSYLYF